MIEISPAIVLLLAFVTDVVAGDPPNRRHPVAWMGHCIARYRRWARGTGNRQQFVNGLILLLVGGFVTAGVGWLIQRGCRECPLVAAVIVQAAVLKCTFSVRSLAGAASQVADALQAGNLPCAREQVAYHLVSRDVSMLDAAGLSAATIESVTENASDSIVAPLFYFVIAGLPGALVYRFVNTCDAMLGYRTAELEWFGKPAARLDDLLNLIPARLTAVMMLGVGGICSHRRGNGGFRRAVLIWKRDCGLTSSPNAGHPMSAAAGVLGVALEKRDHYRLGAELPAPTAAAIPQAITLLWATASIAVSVFCTALLIRGLL